MCEPGTRNGLTFLECCEIVRSGGLRMIRPSGEASGQYDLCEPFENEKGWTWLDAVTANVVCQVYSALSPERQEKFKALPAGVILNFCWKIVEKAPKSLKKGS